MDQQGLMAVTSGESPGAALAKLQERLLLLLILIDLDHLARLLDGEDGLQELVQPARGRDVVLEEVGKSVHAEGVGEAGAKGLTGTERVRRWRRGEEEEEEREEYRGLSARRR